MLTPLSPPPVIAPARGEGLRATGVTVRFGRTTAVDDAVLAAPPGTVTGLVGPAGAGKSTLCDVVSGLCRPQRGSVRWDGTELTGLAAHERARSGLARTFQRPAACWPLTVRENVRLAAEIHAVTRPTPGRSARDRWRRRRAACRAAGEVADAVLARVGIADHAERPAGAVPPEVARLLELARALAARPRLLVLDDPWTDLPEARARALEVLVRDLAAEGAAVLLTGTDLESLIGVCDVLYALDGGRVVASGPPVEVRAGLRAG